MTQYTSNLPGTVCIAVDGQQHVIQQGTHQCTPEAAAAMLQHAGLRPHVLAGDLRIEGEVAGLPAAPPQAIVMPDHLLDFTVREAKVLIGTCEDLDIIAEWQIADGRKGVIKACQKRIAELEA